MHDAATQPQGSIAGLVERVTYHNEENGWCVLRLKVGGLRDLVTLTGHAPSVNPGEYAAATGRWTNDRVYGRQFVSDTLRISPPTTLDGIEKYLGSGMVKGIGPACAGRLVKAFGVKVFEVIENDPDRLYEVEGIGPKRVRKITSGWADQKVIRRIMVFLHGNGVSTSKAVRIYRCYGEKAVETVQENPYRLAQDIRGIGFKSADTIARKLGIAEDSPLRARAGVSYTLMEVSGSEGHCCLPRSVLAEKASELLGIPAAVIDEAISHELEERKVIEDSLPEAGSIYPAPLFFAEKSAAEAVKLLRSGGTPWRAINTEAAIPWVERRLGIRLAESQRRAVETVLSSKVSVVTGGPGVGKTTIVKSILTILQAKNVSCALCAPTGRAAKRLSESSGAPAKTIHRLLEVDPADGKFKRNEMSPVKCDLLIVDECSMIDVPLANSLLKAVPSHAAVIFVGDADQLPSVGPGAFLNDLIDSGAVPVIRLTEVFRQASDSWIIRGAHRINHGQWPQFAKKGDEGDFFWINVDEPEKIADMIVYLVKERIPASWGYSPVRDVQVLCPMNRGGTGARALNDLLQQALNPPGENAVARFGTAYGIGDKVMQVENNYDRNVFNGDIGFITKIDREEEEVTVDFDGTPAVYPFTDLDELVLCYATTIHKSQGSEYPCVVIPVCTQHFMMLKRNLIYTGVTRGRQRVILVGQKKALGMALGSKKALVRRTGLRGRLQDPGSGEERLPGL